MIIIVKGASTIINPPSYGQYLIEILNIKYKSKANYNKSEDVIHICFDGLERFTRCDGIVQPAIYTMLKGHTVWESVSGIMVRTHIKQPMTIYFTNSGGQLINDNTPIITFSFKLLEKETDHKM